MRGLSSLVFLVLFHLALSVQGNATSYVSSLRTRTLYSQVATVVTRLENSTKIALPCGSGEKGWYDFPSSTHL